MLISHLSYNCLNISRRVHVVAKYHEQRQYATHLGRIQVYLTDDNVYEVLGIQLRIQRI